MPHAALRLLHVVLPGPHRTAIVDVFRWMQDDRLALAQPIANLFFRAIMYIIAQLAMHA